jgi:hypothetical protein
MLGETVCIGIECRNELCIFFNYAQQNCLSNSCAVLTRETEEYSRNMAFPCNIGHAWASFGGWGTPPQTKHDGSIPRHIAQFVRIMCQVMYGLCLHLFQTCSPSRWLHSIHCVYIYCSVFNTKLCKLTKFVLLQVKNKPNH